LWYSTTFSAGGFVVLSVVRLERSMVGFVVGVYAQLFWVPLGYLDARVKAKSTGMIAKGRATADSFASLRNNNQKTGNDNGNDRMRGSLHCAVHGRTVNSFGRDDEFVKVRTFGDG
jgi:hypothetical protein